MPESYRLYNKEECLAFFEFLKGDEYKKIIEESGLGFIMKAGRDVHRGEGIEIMTPDVEERYMKTYDSGRKCG